MNPKIISVIDADGWAVNVSLTVRKRNTKNLLHILKHARRATERAESMSYCRVCREYHDDEKKSYNKEKAKVFRKYFDNIKYILSEREHVE